MNDADDDGKKRFFFVMKKTEIFLIIKYCLNDQRKILIFFYICVAKILYSKQCFLLTIVVFSTFCKT